MSLVQCKPVGHKDIPLGLGGHASLIGSGPSSLCLPFCGAGGGRRRFPLCQTSGRELCDFSRKLWDKALI